MTTERTPAEVFPPGEFIREELEARGWTQAELARRSGLPAGTISPVVAGHRRISRAVAEGLASAFGGSAAYWLGLDMLYHRVMRRAVCPQCRQAMYPQRSTRRYCGVRCRQRAWLLRRREVSA